MTHSKNWLVTLDLTDIDDLLLGYANFLASGINPDQVTFLHIFESTQFTEDLKELFPELSQEKDLKKIVRKELEDKIRSVFPDTIKTNLILKEGDPTDVIIRQIQDIQPDLLFLGKKEKYQGEGVLTKKIVRYVPCSVLFVPESVRYQLKNILVPFNFNGHSAAAIKFGQELSDRFNAKLQLQHVYNYPAQYFPYMPSENVEEKMKKQLAEKLQKFKGNYELDEDLDIDLTLNKQEKVQEKIYNLSIKIQADLIAVGSKGKKNMASFLKEDLSDKMINYSFGKPILIHKEKGKHERFFESLLKD